MFIVVVTLPGSFPFPDLEAFPTVDGAIGRAREWLAWGGAKLVEVFDEAGYAAKDAADKSLLVGLGAALGLGVAAEALGLAEAA